MFKPVFAGAVIAFGVLQWQPSNRAQRFLQLKEETMTIEYMPADGVAALIVAAESEESMEIVEVRSPAGEPMFSVSTANGKALAFSGLKVETQEAGIDELFEIYAAGRYDLRARTVEGLPLVGRAVLSHRLLREPVVTYPRNGDVNVPSSGLNVTWNSDSEALGYRVVLEQGENDGLTAQLSSGTNSFRVPDGVLVSGKQAHLEVGAIAPNGNCTLVEIDFTTL